MRLPASICYANIRLLVIVIGYCHCIWYVLLFPAFWIIIGLVKRSCSPWCMVKWGCNSLIMIMEICLPGAITTSSICDEGERCLFVTGNCTRNVNVLLVLIVLSYLLSFHLKQWPSPSVLGFTRTFDRNIICYYLARIAYLVYCFGWCWCLLWSVAYECFV